MLTITFGSQGTSPFEDLPAALLDEILGETSTVARNILSSFNEIAEGRNSFRDKLENSGLLVDEASLGDVPPQTTCAADGSYAIERLLATDLAAAAAVIVEGLTPPSDSSFWERPHHKVFVASEPHYQDTSTVLRAVMLGEELRLLAKAPHDLPMLDGTFALPIIYFNQAMNSSSDAHQLNCNREFVRNCKSYLEAYLHVLTSKCAGKQFIALPKYSTRREIGNALAWPERYDDRGILTILLNEGELIKPQPLSHDHWHFNTNKLQTPNKRDINEIANEIVSALGSVYMTYYKPRAWLPAFRIEFSKAIAVDSSRLAAVLRGIKMQTVTPAMLAPFPVHLADRTVRAVVRSIPAVKQVTTQRIAEEFDGDIGEVFFAMHGYRSISGM